MGRVSTALKMAPEQRSVLNAVIRRHSYCSLDAMLAELRAREITMSRSALHRWAQQLEATDSLHAGTPNDTIVVIMERGTGGTTTIATTASRDAVLAAIEALSTSN